MSVHYLLRRGAPGFRVILLSVCVFLPFLPITKAQTAEDLKRDRLRGIVMLALLKDYIKEYYYDAAFHGMDVEARFKTADEKVNQAANLSQVLGIVAQVLVDLNDSHTFFIPPSRAVDVHYGWKMQMIGDVCYVVAVEPGSDAEAQGLKPGDEVVSLDGFKPTRASIWKMDYNYNVLRP